MNKEFEFKTLINKKGFFCKITYEASVTERSVLNFEYKLSDTKWMSALLFGANYFFEKYSSTRNTGIKIIIKNIESQIIDTSNLVVLLTMIELLSKEFNFMIDGFKLNDYGDLVLPK